ncbi:MAG: hypothetical protein KDA96_22965, partial [Planctomycetaceae bacterium]|nr:hypothetical protein [Planctomycetaceae bacterium]
AIFRATLVASLFWFLGGVTQPAVNNLGREVLLFNETRTSLLTAGIGVGIAVGCLLAGVVSVRYSAASWVRCAAWALVCCLIAIALLSAGVFGFPTARPDRDVTIRHSLVVAGSLEWVFRAAMVALGVAAGAFVVPIQTYLQTSPPAGQKGRLLGSVNLLTWVAIVLSAVYLGVGYPLLNAVTAANSRLVESMIFASLALIILPIAVWYRLGSERS